MEIKIGMQDKVTNEIREVTVGDFDLSKPQFWAFPDKKQGGAQFPYLQVTYLPDPPGQE